VDIDRGQPLKTKGAVVWEINAPWSIDEIEIGDPRHGEVTVPSPWRCLVNPQPRQSTKWKYRTIGNRIAASDR
jgi:hypothetical protein